MLAAAARGGASPDPREPATTATSDGSFRQEICALSGLPASRFCPNRISEWVAADTPAEPCSWHTGARHGMGVSWPVEYVAWAATETAAPVTPLRRADADQRAVEPAFRVVSPPDGAVYLLDPTLRREFQSVTLRAAADERGPIEWRIDGTRLAATAAPVEWPLEAGRHIITARDVRGRQADATIVVK